jgi:molybdopterin biosynthesis enzyme
MRHPRARATRYVGKLIDPITKRPGKDVLVPCVSEWRDGAFVVRPLRTHGSADIFSTTGMNSIAIAPANVERLGRGETVSFLRFGPS